MGGEDKGDDGAGAGLGTGAGVWIKPAASLNQNHKQAAKPINQRKTAAVIGCRVFALAQAGSSL